MKYGIEDCYNRSSERDARASRIGIGGARQGVGTAGDAAYACQIGQRGKHDRHPFAGVEKGSEVEVAVEGDNEQAVLDEVVAAIEAITD